MESLPSLPRPCCWMQHRLAEWVDRRTRQPPTTRASHRLQKSARFLFYSHHGCSSKRVNTICFALLCLPFPFARVTARWVFVAKWPCEKVLRTPRPPSLFFRQRHPLAFQTQTGWARRPGPESRWRRSFCASAETRKGGDPAANELAVVRRSQISCILPTRHHDTTKFIAV
ncbi:hypothetical protein BC940DRAFT_42362 [Gongronella butleri]|nr:hypothetical protein BC940DRAFT_42362 [Gongronella butleri]